MKLKNNFVAMLIGENSELKTRKSDGTMYSYNTVAIMQDGMVDNLRAHENFFKALKDMEHFKMYQFAAEFNTDYKEYVVMDARLFDK